MELHSFHRELAVAQAHDRPVRSRRGHLEDLGHRRRVDDERVVAGGDERVGKSEKDALVRRGSRSRSFRA